jgi:hypothetical protein
LGIEALHKMRKETPLLVVDLHAEASSEKAAFAWHADGLATAVVGTHTHVPTSDSRILTRGTAFQTDVGMTGGYDGVIGMDKEASIRRFVTGLPIRFEPATGDLRLDAVVIDADPRSGRALAIRSVQKKLREETS